MPFRLYNVAEEAGLRQYTFVNHTRLAGKCGPLASFARSANVEQRVPFPWHATEGDIIRNLNNAQTKQAIVIDLKPHVAGNISLYRLRDVWGFSYQGWTPLALRLQTLFVDHNVANPAVFKNSFSDIRTDHQLVGEFLYLQGGVSTGTWKWGMVGRVNGAILWRDSFDFLVRSLQSALDEPA